MGFIQSLDAPFVCLFIIISTSSAILDNDSCTTQRANVESGRISLRSSLHRDDNCRWIVSAPPGKKLLVDIEDIHLASENHTLSVSMDDSGYNVPRECEKCWTNMVGEILNVTFVSRGVADVNVTENELFSDISSNDSYASSFSIFYRSFDPRRCEAPRPVANAYYLEKDWSRGGTIHYRCNPPYEPVGSVVSTCVVLEDSPVPVWNEKSFECAIPPCDTLTINKTAGRGTIVHPGYPSKTVLPNQTCQWNIGTDSDRRIAVFVRNFGLPMVKGKHKTNRSFLEISEGDGGHVLLHLQGQMVPQSLTTSTNRLTIALRTGDVNAKTNDAGGLYGFTIEYETTCRVLVPPKNGYFALNRITVGSITMVECDPEFRVEGESVLRCLPDATWNASGPVCVSRHVATFTRMPSTKQFTTLASKGSKKTDVLHEQNAAEKEKEVKTPKDIDDVVDLSDLEVDDEVETMYKKSRPSEPPMDMLTAVMITLGIALPLLMITASVVAYFWYRKRYPARMGFGRKFETFENPIYQKNKRRHGNNTNENPAELQRLTMIASP